MLRKFYEVAAEEAGATDTAVVETKVETAATEKPTLAEAMAKAGVKTEGLSKVDIPSNDKEAKEETKTTETATPAATATEVVKVEKVESEAPKSEVTKVEDTKPQTEVAPKQELSWQEVLKQQQPNAILQALGYDEELTNLIGEMKELDPKVLGLFQSYKNGTTTEYLRELSTDYTKMTDQEVMRHQLRLEYPKASDKQLETLFKKEVVEKYDLDSDDPEILEEGATLMSVIADKNRDTFIEKQKNYLLPKPSEKKQDEPPAVDPRIQEQQQMVERVTKQINEDPYTQSLVAKNTFTFGEGDEQFNFPIDGKSITDLVINGDESGDLMFDKIVDENGKEQFNPKVKHQALVAIVNKYGDKFIDELIKHGKSLGGKKAIEPIDNAKPIETQSTTAQSASGAKSLAEAMAKAGKMVNS